ncbi:uncharacterized protein BDR25DRAFT_256894 [Lindgomyces ingoldianus]|uniref:Uncharacterized protein n=1 Tax=Lindgomyces ingoldianus TaxID=673940 RepID=A0ACB6R3R4_9PLEO|nr:uncharacterized protein BDR25DRAFT_256894 [Lindgomyces ingoldianus]KAF2473894.1 hypothetical protein BDR25DRAFT_256894 [Lindgomyces ingoldianus]
MVFLRDVSDRFWSYVSPRKTQQRREKPFKVPALPQPVKTPHAIKKEERRTESMSPTTRVKSWHVKTPGSSASTDEADRLPSPTSLERPYTDFEGDTLIDDMVEAIDDQEAFDANEETFVVDEAKYMDEQKAYDADTERQRRDKQGRELRAVGWTEDAVFLFQKLGMRGFEPLMPKEWMNDFIMLPTNLFTPNMDKAFIKPTFGRDYHAQKALKELFELGGRARDAILQKVEIRTAEDHLRRAVRKYNKWAVKDGGLENIWHSLSLFDIVSLSKDTSPAILQEKMLHKLAKLAALWRDAFRARSTQPASESEDLETNCRDSQDLPTLYGIIASHTIMAIVSYDAMAANPSLRTVAIFDFGQEDYDVWNSLAIAIMVIHCRNRMRELQEFLPEPEAKAESDPDV